MPPITVREVKVMVKNTRDTSWLRDGATWSKRDGLTWTV